MTEAKATAAGRDVPEGASGLPVILYFAAAIGALNLALFEGAWRLARGTNAVTTGSRRTRAAAGGAEPP